MTVEQGQLERTTGLVLVMDLTDNNDADLSKLESIRSVLHAPRPVAGVPAHPRRRRASGCA